MLHAPLLDNVQSMHRSKGPPSTFPLNHCTLNRLFDFPHIGGVFGRLFVGHAIIVSQSLSLADGIVFHCGVHWVVFHWAVFQPDLADLRLRVRFGGGSGS